MTTEQATPLTVRAQRRIAANKERRRRNIKTAVATPVALLGLAILVSPFVVMMMGIDTLFVIFEVINDLRG